MNYDEFIQKKHVKAIESGFECEVSDKLFDFQQHIVKTALRVGRYAIFADCGLGKSAMQIEWAMQVHKHTGEPVLILCPLAVAPQTVREAKNIFGYEISRDITSKGIVIANYEQLENLPDWYGGIVLDESSILKNFQGKTKQRIIDKFRSVRFKLCASATPDPNDDTEIGNHAEFLGIMTRLAMLSRFFVHDGGETQKWRLKGHVACMSLKTNFIRYLRDVGLTVNGLRSGLSN